MSIFNNLTPFDGKRDVTKRTMQRAAAIGEVLPKLNRQQRAKLKPALTAIAAATGAAAHHNVNSAHHVRSKGEMLPKDRLATLARAIAKVQKLNPQVLGRDGVMLKDHVVELGWLAYAKLEMHGTDNAHFQETHLPCNVDGFAGLPSEEAGFAASLWQPGKTRLTRKVAHGLPWSRQYRPNWPTTGDWFAALSLPRHRQQPTIDAAPCRAHPVDPNANLGAITCDTEWRDHVGGLLESHKVSTDVRRAGNAADMARGFCWIEDKPAS